MLSLFGQLSALIPDNVSMVIVRRSWSLLVLGVLVACGGTGRSTPVAEPAKAAVVAPGEEVTPAPVAFDASTPEAYTAWAKARLEGLKVSSTSPKPLELRVGGAESGKVVYLHRPWEFCQGNSDVCRQASEEYVDRIAQVLLAKDAPPSLEALRVVVRDREYIEESQRRFKGGPVRIVHQPLVGTLSLVVVVDTQAATKMLFERHLSELGASRDQVIERALANTRTHLGGTFTFEIPEGTAILLDRAPYYESSRLALHASWKPIADKTKGELLVAIPSGGIVLVANGTGPKVVGALAEAAAKLFAAAQRPLSKQVFRWTETGWDVAHPGVQ